MICRSLSKEWWQMWNSCKESKFLLSMPNEFCFLLFGVNKVSCGESLPVCFWPKVKAQVNFLTPIVKIAEDETDVGFGNFSEPAYVYVLLLPGYKNRWEIIPRVSLQRTNTQKIRCNAKFGTFSIFCLGESPLALAAALSMLSVKRKL